MNSPKVCEHCEHLEAQMRRMQRHVERMGELCDRLILANTAKDRELETLHQFVTHLRNNDFQFSKPKMAA